MASAILFRVPVVPAFVRAFRARFDGVAADERAERRPVAQDDDARFRACLELHALALWQDIERVRAELGDVPGAEVASEVNRRRLASSPIPPSLAERARKHRAPG